MTTATREHIICILFAKEWEVKFGRKYQILPIRDHRWARELIEVGVENDEIVRRARTYFKDEFFQNVCKCSFEAFVKHFHWFVSRKTA